MASAGTIPMASGDESSDTQVVLGVRTAQEGVRNGCCSGHLILAGLGYGAVPLGFLQPGSAIASLAVLPFINCRQIPTPSTSAMDSRKA